MNRIYGREVWSIGDVVVADNRTIEYNNVTCWDAATMIAEAFGTEWWTDGFTFNLALRAWGAGRTGLYAGLTSLVQSENSDSVKFFTRLIPWARQEHRPLRYGFSRLQLLTGPNMWTVTRTTVCMNTWRRMPLPEYSPIIRAV